MTRRFLAPFVLAAAILPGPAPAWAQNRSSLGLGLGVVDPEDIDTALWTTLNFRVPVGRQLIVEPELGFWKKTEDIPGGEISLQDFNLGANLLVDFGGSGAFSFWVGAGLGAHLIKAEVQVGGLDVESDTATELGVHLLGGLDYDIDRDLGLFLAARYDIVTSDGDGNFEQAKVYAGLRIRF